MKKSLSSFVGSIKENASTLAMASAIGLLACSLVAAFKASDDISEAKKEYAEEIIDNEDLDAAEVKKIKRKRNVKYLYAYRWVLIFGLGSASLTFLSNYLNGLVIAGLATTLAAREDKIRALVKHGKEILGEEKFQEIENKALGDQLKEQYGDDIFNGEDSFPEGSLPTKVKYGDGIFVVDTDMNKIFQIKKERLDYILNWAENEAITRGLSRNEFQQALRKDCRISGYTGWWGPGNPFKARIGYRYINGAFFKTIEYENHASSKITAGLC